MPEKASYDYTQLVKHPKLLGLYTGWLGQKICNLVYSSVISNDFDSWTTAVREVYRLLVVISATPACEKQDIQNAAQTIVDVYQNQCWFSRDDTRILIARIEERCPDLVELIEEALCLLNDQSPEEWTYWPRLDFEFSRPNDWLGDPIDSLNRLVSLFALHHRIVGEVRLGRDLASLLARLYTFPVSIECRSPNSDPREEQYRTNCENVGKELLARGFLQEKMNLCPEEKPRPPLLENDMVYANDYPVLFTAFQKSFMQCGLQAPPWAPDVDAVPEVFVRPPIQGNDGETNDTRKREPDAPDYVGQISQDAQEGSKPGEVQRTRSSGTDDRSPPMSKVELARRYRNDQSARIRSAEKWLAEHDLRQEAAGIQLWTISLKGLDRSTRNRIVNGLKQ